MRSPLCVTSIWVIYKVGYCKLCSSEKKLLRKFTLLLLTCCVVLATLARPAALYAQDGAADYTFGDCSQLDKDGLRAEIEAVAVKALAADSAGIDLDAIVMRQWVTVGMDSAIDREVERAINEVYESESYWSRLWSGWSADKAEEFALRIANSAFGSEGFQAQISALSNAIADEIAREIEADFARAASAAFLCMKAYVGDKYSGTLFTTFEQKVSTEVEQVNVQANAANVDVSALEVHSKALGGVGLIVVTEISRRIAIKLSEKIAERIAGKIVGRIIGKAGSTLIPVAGWVIGLGLIVWDLWEGGNGALPQIRDALQSEEVKSKVRQEVADAVKSGLPEEVSIVALEIAVNLVEEWDSFCDNQRSVCTLAIDNPTFKDILDYTPLDQIEKLVALVNVFVDNIGRAELESAVDDGQFEQLMVLPEGAFTLLASTKSVDTTLAWAALAGDRLDRAVALGIPQSGAPADFDPQLLGALLNVDNNEMVTKLLALDLADLRAIQQFGDSNFVRLANRLSAAELNALADYLAANSTPPTDLAAALASGAQSVADLQIAAAPPAPDGRASAGSFPALAVPSLALVWNYIYRNSIVVASGAVLLIALLVGTLSSLGRKRRPKRDVYDIFGDR